MCRLMYGFGLKKVLPITDARYFGGRTEEDWFEVFAASQGIEVVNRPDVNDLAPDADHDELWRPYDTYSRTVQAKLAAEFGNCSVEKGGHRDRPVFFVAGLQPELEHNGPFTPLDLTKLQELATAEVRANLQKFCQAMGVDYQEPTWQLVEEWQDDE